VFASIQTEEPMVARKHSIRAVSCGYLFMFVTLQQSIAQFSRSGSTGGTGMLATQLDKGVQVIPREEQRRIDVTVDGMPFTSYLWPTTLKTGIISGNRSGRYCGHVRLPVLAPTRGA